MAGKQTYDELVTFKMTFSYRARRCWYVRADGYMTDGKAAGAAPTTRADVTRRSCQAGAGMARSPHRAISGWRVPERAVALAHLLAGRARGATVGAAAAADRTTATPPPDAPSLLTAENKLGRPCPTHWAVSGHHGHWTFSSGLHPAPPPAPAGG